MARLLALKRVTQLGANLGTSLAASGGFAASKAQSRHICQLAKSNGEQSFASNGEQPLEGQGLPSKQATDFVSKSEFQKFKLDQESELQKIKDCLLALSQFEKENLSGHRKKMFNKPRCDMQDNHFSSLQHEIEKRWENIEKIYTEIRKTMDGIKNESDVITNIAKQLDREIHALKAQLQADKNEAIHYSIWAVDVAIAVATFTW